MAHRELCQEKQVGGPLNCSNSELCIYLRALEEGYLPTCSLDTNQYARSKSIHIASKYYRKGKKTVSFHGFQFLKMSQNLTENRGEELLTAYLEGFRAKTLAARERVMGLKVESQDCGLKCSELLAKYDQNSCSWKTQIDLFPEDLAGFSETWPLSGTMRNGCAYERENVGRTMLGRAYGFLPTPTAHNAKEGAYPAEYTRKTPTLATHAGGKINPEWTEWLMHWPTGWTDLKPLGMDKFQSWRQLHFKS